MWLPDLRFAARLLGKNPLFTGGVIGLLALGIAANTVVFSVVDALLLRPLPVRDPERLVRMVTIRPPLRPLSEFVFEEEFQLWQKQVSGFEDLFAWSEFDMFLAVGESTERARVHFITGNFFEALGVKPAQGRLLSPDDDAPRGTLPVVLSHHYWQRRFAGDTGVVGRIITIEGHKAVVVGVTPKAFNGMTVETSPDVRLPIGWVRTLRPNLYENHITCEVAGRLRADVSPEAVRQQAESIWRNGWRARYKLDPGEPGRFVLEPASRGVSRMRTQFGGVLWLLMCGVGLLGLMVCANVAGLLISRAAGRQAELAVRVAMGATRLQLVRQLFCEALLLMLGGAAGAMALSLLAIPLLVDALPPVRDASATRLALTLGISPDWRVLGFSLLVSSVAVLLFGFAPALIAARRDLHPLLKEARAGSGWRGRQVLVVVQVALCTILLTGAALTILTLRRLEGMNAGFVRDRVVLFGVDADMANYNPEQSVELRRRLLDAARALPDVQFAAASSRGLMRGTGVKSTVAWAGERALPADFMGSSGHSVSPEYFETMGIQWVAGRNFTGREDFKKVPKPVIVNRAFVRRFGGGRVVIGEKFGNVAVNGEPAQPSFEVIGVVGDAKYRSLREPFQPTVYSMLVPGQDFILHLRTRAAPEAVIAPMRRLLARIDPRLSYIEVTTLAGEVAASLWAERVAAYLATVFSAAAALIAAGGLYALLAFAVMQRRREIGIRVALGALPRDVMRLIFGRAALLALGGIAVGLTAAWAVAPRIAAILFEVEPRDERALAAAAVFVFAVTAVAALIPSFRASRIHPASVLRQE
jgi:predicted permease